MNNKIITIDGPAGSGKTTVGKMLETSLEGGCACISSGLVYRMLADGFKDWDRFQSVGKLPPGFRTVHQIMKLNNWKFHGTEVAYDNTKMGEYQWDSITESFYGEKIDKASSKVAKNPVCRKLVSMFLKRYIKKITRFDPNWPEKYMQGYGYTDRLIPEWQDVYPEYIVVEGRDIGSVVFPDAKWKIYLDASLQARVGRRNKERAGAGDGISARDREDMEREASPLIVPRGAFVIDSTSMGLEDVVEKIVNYVKKS